MIEDLDELRVEKKDLREKLMRLRKFLDSRMSNSIPKEERNLLIAQKRIMYSYGHILRARIKLLAEKFG